MPLKCLHLMVVGVVDIGVIVVVGVVVFCVVVVVIVFNSYCLANRLA